MNEMTLFSFENNQVRTVVINNVPYFVGNDVAQTLGYTDYRHAVTNHVSDEDKLRVQIDHAGQGRLMTVISESGVYDLIFDASRQGKNEEIRLKAKKFRHWVTNKVLPSIRKHGAYLTDEKIEEVLMNPDTVIKLATQLKTERSGQLIAEQQVKELQPKADYYDQILANKGLVAITSIAKNYGMTANELNKKLHELGVQYRQSGNWYLYSKYQNGGYTHTLPVPFTHRDGRKDIRPQTKWTQKGHIFIYELLKKHGIVPMIEQDLTA